MKVSVKANPAERVGLMANGRPNERHQLALPIHCCFSWEGGMPTITTRDGAQIFYKDWGSGQPVVFSHGWPLNADAWDEQLFFFASNGFRAIAHDRRGHGRSTQTWSGNDMDTYADDLAAVVQSLGLTNVIHIGHSTGG